MNSLLAARLGSWLLVLLGAGALVRAFTAPLVPAPGAPASLAPAQDTASARDVRHPGAETAVVAERDLFRRSRRPGSKGGMPPDGAGIPQPANASPKPALRLLGLVAGARPTAVIEGLPRTSGPRVVGPGEVFAGLTIRRISAAGVEVAGLDTTWLLTLRRP